LLPLLLQIGSIQKTIVPFHICHAAAADCMFVEVVLIVYLDVGEHRVVELLVPGVLPVNNFIDLVLPRLIEFFE
jgi:hypothetical protein